MPDYNKKGIIMTEKLINRINELARKSKTEGLSAAELEEQKKLRAEYIAEFRKGFEQNYLENMYFIDENGNEHKIAKKNGSICNNRKL